MLIKFGHVLWLELIQGSKIDKIEGKQVSFRLFFFFDLTEKLDGFIIWLMRMSLWQDLTNAGVVYLCHFVQGLAGAGSQKPELLQVNIISKSTLLISNYLPFNQKLAQVEWFKWLVLDSWMLGRGLLNAYFLSNMFGLIIFISNILAWRLLQVMIQRIIINCIHNWSHKFETMNW